MNLVVLVGRLGRDAEVTYTKTGQCVCNLSVATSERVGRGREQVTTWHKVVVWSNTAAVLKKGELVAIEGKLRTEKWKDKKGNDRETLAVVCWRVRRLAMESSETEKGPRPNARPGKGESKWKRKRYQTRALFACVRRLRTS